MATNFPTSLDTFPNAATLSTHRLSTDPHSLLHGNIGDSLAAVQAKMGTDNSAVTSSMDYSLNNLKPALIQGRLTLSSGVPVTTGDVTGATTVYYTPYRGDNISLYSTTAGRWFTYTSPEVSTSLSGLTANLPADVFAYWTGSAVALEVVNWTNGTTRATGLALQDGVYTKSGNATRLYLGTICGSGTGTCEDSQKNRFVCNYANRQPRKFLGVEPSNTSWVYNTATYRPMNNNTGNQAHVVSGLGDTIVDFFMLGASTIDVATTRYSGIGIDSTSTPSYDYNLGATATFLSYSYTYLKSYITTGYHYIQPLECGAGSNNTTWYGQSVFGVSGILQG